MQLRCPRESRRAFSRVADPRASLPEWRKHRTRIDPHEPTDQRQRPALLVELDSLVDLVREETTSPHRHIVTMQELAHRPPVGAELVTQFVDGRPAW